jgi:hypothetical protein
METNVSSSVDCAACGRRLATQGYQAAPSEVVPKDQITRHYNPAHPFFSVLCPCGHYTVSSPFLKDKPIADEIVG